ncbi:phage tail protein [Haloplanus rubicundus]|uniref:Phage tail protein n=1 Tax=Haloplanus rubicundus TaxID=1547898 RepID=A0A345ECQ5_9EURY|nr:phage tail protein [Haloplanus rubicundus]AXG09977.1 phage tail protein [Haloplanus rubicundus]
MPDRHGPFRVARFLLEIDGVAKAGFTRCRIPDSSTAVVEYREGNDPPTPRKLAGLNEYGSLELRYGVTTDAIELYEWRRLVEQGKVDEARRSIAVVLLDEEGAPAARWELRNAWPRRYAAPTLDAGRSAVAIETLEIVCEGLRRVDTGSETDGAGERAEHGPPTPRKPSEGLTDLTRRYRPDERPNLTRKSPDEG